LKVGVEEGFVVVMTTRSWYSGEQTWQCFIDWTQRWTGEAADTTLLFSPCGDSPIACNCGRLMSYAPSLSIGLVCGYARRNQLYPKPMDKDGALPVNVEV
jgi:hypothetical protein